MDEKLIQINNNVKKEKEIDMKIENWNITPRHEIQCKHLSAIK